MRTGRGEERGMKNETKGGRWGLEERRKQEKGRSCKGLLWEEEAKEGMKGGQEGKQWMRVAKRGTGGREGVDAVQL